MNKKDAEKLYVGQKVNGRTVLQSGPSAGYPKKWKDGEVVSVTVKDDGNVSLKVHTPEHVAEWTDRKTGEKKNFTYFAKERWLPLHVFTGTIGTQNYVMGKPMEASVTAFYKKGEKPTDRAAKKISKLQAKAAKIAADIAKLSVKK